MKPARLEYSKRLQRVLFILSDYREHTTREIERGADVSAVNDAVNELRSPINGFQITCRAVGKGRFAYRLCSTSQK